MLNHMKERDGVEPGVPNVPHKLVEAAAKRALTALLGLGDRRVAEIDADWTMPAHRCGSQKLASSAAEFENVDRRRPQIVEAALEFPSNRIALIAGIGGGRPHDSRLRDLQAAICATLEAHVIRQRCQQFTGPPIHDVRGPDRFVFAPPRLRESCRANRFARRQLAAAARLAGDHCIVSSHASGP